MANLVTMQRVAYVQGPVFASADSGYSFGRPFLIWLLPIGYRRLARMAGYLKIWTSLLCDEKFLTLTGNQRSVYLQLLLACKCQSDTGQVHFKNYSHIAQEFNGDDSTVTRALLKLHSVGLIRMERDVHNIITIELPNYQYWQQLTVKEFHQQNSKRAIKTVQKSPTRPDQTRPDQTKPSLVAEKSGDHQKAIQYFCDLYFKKHQEGGDGIKYHFIKGKDGKLVKELLATYGFDFFCRLVDQIYITNDEFIINKGKVTIGVLSACANKLAQEIISRKDARSTFTEKERQSLINIAQGLGLDHKPLELKNE